jgi:hypothetical protein
MYAAFAEGIGNFGTNIQERWVLPYKALGKFGHTGNYIFGTVEDAQRFKEGHRGYVALIASQDLRSIIYDLDKQMNLSIERGFFQQSEFRVRLNETTFTIGALFHERRPTPEEIKRCLYVKVLDSHTLHSIVLKRENMAGGKLDSKNRIAWGKVSSIVHCGATARSMSTIVGTANKMFRIGRLLRT